ncbi:alpha/beta hydrolase family protein [Brevundimonas lenta]|uniref:Dipeptidyl aminopeptidase/acylaminoacyl peptidase n=1 Tax=Brevundimonas lenta TaxID=424796 RepID=A0A7W6JE18_9CAUL|nr:prolyl oligopeptidase family serine peptidase [Brevundimonas lenta]MBB4082422.1 dipeptidyl aminopeptidase/acylaminoacyl peptidase [Brevundimonas lenta]
MIKVSILALAGALAVSTAAVAQPAPSAPADASAAAVTAPTIEQMSALPAISSLAVSPDGKHIAGVEARGDSSVILVWDLERPGSAPTAIGSAQMKIQGVTFVKDNVLGVSLWQPFDQDNYKTFIGKFMLTDLEGKEWHDPMSVLRARSEGEERFARLSSADLLDRLPNDPDNILLSIGAEVYRLNVRTNRSERIQRAGERTIGYVTDLTGALRTRAVADRDGEGLYISTQLRNDSGGWDEHIRNHIKDREVFAIAGFTADPNIAYVISNRGRDKAAIFEYDVRSRQLGEVAFEHPLFEATGVAVDNREGPTFGQVISFHYAGPRDDEYVVDPEYAALNDALKSALNIQETPLRFTDPATGQTRMIRYPQDRYFNIVSISEDMNVAVVWAGGVNDPGQYYLLKNKTELTPLSRPYPGVNPAALGTTQMVSYKARDGLDVPAFLSRPPASFGPGPFPTVIMPHGGPWSRDNLEWDYSWWRVLLTSRGYAVLQPQFRGSDGWGRRLWTAGDNEWGQKMQDDLDDGAKWLVEQGVAQQDRVAMFGFSYGGYAAMAAAVRPNGNYKCAIAGAGVSDLSRIRSGLFRNPYTREAQRDTVNGLSPVTQANRIQIPIMLFHGDRDTTVELEQSAAFVGAARGSGQDVQYHVVQDYAHGPAWTPAVEAQQLRLIEDYLRTGCGGNGL